MFGTVSSALAALSGSGIGGAASFFSSWLAQSAQRRAQLFLHDKGRRHDLYREFIDEASASYIDALTSSTPDLTKQIHIYSLVSCMRMASSPEAVEYAHQIAQLIINSYMQPNKPLPDLQQMANDEEFLDPLCDFCEACRRELNG